MKRLVLNPRRRHHGELRAGRRAAATTATTSAGPWAAQSSATSCSSSDRGRPATSAVEDLHTSPTTRRDTIDQKRTVNSAFGKVNYDPTNRLRSQLLGALDADDVGGHAAGLRLGRAERDREHAGVEPDPEDARLRDRRRRATRARSTSRSSNSLAAERPRRLLRRQLHGHGRPDLQQRDLPDLEPRRAVYPIPANLRGGVGFQNTPRVQLAPYDHTKRGYGQIGLRAVVQRRRQPQPEGRASATSRRPTRWTTRTRAAATCSSGGTARFTSSVTGLTDRGPYGYYEVNDFGTRGKARPTSTRSTCRTSGRSAT